MPSLLTVPYVIDRRKAVEDQTEIRRTLLKNGYTPLPAREKRVLLPGWPTIEPTEKMIDEWGQGLDNRTTAIRVEGDLVAVDIDVDDPFAETIIAKFDEMVDPDGQALLRRGKGRKVMLWARVDEAFGVMRSRAVEKDGGDAQFVEVFSSGASRYFTCFGAHTEGGVTAEGVEVKVAYRWGQDSPLTVPVTGLPVLSREALLKFVLAVGDAMEAAGWTPVPRAPSGLVETGVSRYLTPDMTFDLQDGSTVSLDDLVDHAGVRCSAAWLDGGRNRSRCIISVDEASGMPMIWDSATFCQYVPTDWVSPAERVSERAHTVGADVGAALAALIAQPRYAEKAAEAEAFPTRERKTEKRSRDPEVVFNEKVEEILEGYAYYPSGALSEQVIPLDGRATRSLASFATEFRPYEIVGDPGPRGGKPPMLNPARVWIGRDDRVQVEGYRFTPGSAATLVYEGEYAFVNKWRPADFGGAEPRDLQLFQKLIVHLFPKEDERVWFLNWLAYKLQNPAARGQAVVLVSVMGDAGRGTLFSILQGVFGPSCKPIASSDLLGTSGQADYTEWREDTTLGFCAEFRMIENTYAAKHRAYERLKELADPSVASASVNEKFARRRSIMSPLALLIATNNEDAIPLPPEDRRVTVLTNTDAPLLRQPWADQLHALDSGGGVYDKGFCRAVHDWLMSLAANKRDFMKPLATEARDEMIASGEGKIEGFLRLVLAEYELKGFQLRVASDIVADVELKCEQHGNLKLLDAVEREVRHRLRRGFAGWFYDRHKPIFYRDHEGVRRTARMAQKIGFVVPQTLSADDYMRLTGKQIA